MEEEQLQKQRADLIRENRKDSVYLATELMNELPYLVRSDEKLYVYNGKYYDMINDDDLRSDYGKFVVKFQITDCWRSGKLNDIISFIKVSPFIKEVSMNANPNLLCMNNGVLDINTGEFFEHSKDFYFDTFINVDYDAAQIDCPIFMEYLTHVTRGDADTIENIIRLGGYLLDYDVANMQKCNKMFLFDGVGANGKSVLIDTFSLFFAEEQVTAIELDELAKDDMEKEDLLRSRFNICSEQKRSYISSANIKKIIQGERMKIKRKFLTAVTFKPKTKIVVACNGLPKFDDTSEGIYRRMIIFKFRNQYKSKSEYDRLTKPEEYGIYLQDRDLFKKIAIEKTAIFNLFMEGLKRLRDDNFLFLEGNEFVQIMEEFRNDNDVAREFLTEKYEIDASSFTPISDIFQDFRTWYQANVGGQLKMRRAEISKRIKEVFSIEMNGRTRKKNIDGELEQVTTYPLKKIIYDENPTQQPDDFWGDTETGSQNAPTLFGDDD